MQLKKTKKKKKRVHRTVLLLTEGRRKPFARHVFKATKLAKVPLVMATPSMKALNRVLLGHFGIVIINLNEFKEEGHLFYRTIRMHHSMVPVLYVQTRLIFMEKLGVSLPFKKNIKKEVLAQLMLDAMDFSEIYSSARRAAYKKIIKIKHLKGEKLNREIEKIRIETFGKKLATKLKQKPQLKKLIELSKKIREQKRDQMH